MFLLFIITLRVCRSSLHRSWFNQKVYNFFAVFFPLIQIHKCSINLKSLQALQNHFAIALNETNDVQQNVHTDAYCFPLAGRRHFCLNHLQLSLVKWQKLFIAVSVITVVDYKWSKKTLRLDLKNEPPKIAINKIKRTKNKTRVYSV